MDIELNILSDKHDRLENQRRKERMQESDQKVTILQLEKEIAMLKEKSSN